MAWKRRRYDYFDTGENEADNNQLDMTRQFDTESGEKEKAELSEERSSVRDFTLASLLWRIGRPALIFAVSAALLLFLGIAGFNFVKENYFDPAGSSPEETRTVQIKSGSSLSTIASTLYDQGIIRNKFVFQMYVDFNDMSSSLKAGTYTFSPAMTMDEIVAMLAEGDGGRKYATLVFTEGMTVEDIADTLVSKGVFNAAEKQQFLNLCKDKAAFTSYGYISKAASSENSSERRYLLEGYLFPDTYDIYLDATPEEVIKKLLDRFNAVFTADYESTAETLGLTVDQVLVMASIIEKESLEQDFNKVSAVFHNRLDKGWELESDATVRYALQKLPPFSQDELNTPSPYNTYYVKGLPVGPICNPGKKAIEAVLYPDETFVKDGYMFFVLKSPDSGALAFAITKKEHDANVRAYYDAVEAAKASASPSPTS